MKTTSTPPLKRNLMPLGLSLDQNELAGLSNILTCLVFQVPMVILTLFVFKVLSGMRYVLKSVVRGIQTGLGLLFLKKGLELNISTNVWLGLDRRARAKARYIINKRYPLLNDMTFNRSESHFSYRNSSGEEFAKAYVLITKDVQESAISQGRKQ